MKRWTPWVPALLAALWWGQRMLRMAWYPLPHYEAETSMAWSTHLLLQGLTPWSLSQYPASLNAYGIGYPLLCVPFAWLFGCGLTVLRCVSLACLLAAAALVYRAAIRLGAGRYTSGWAALACLAAWAVSYTPIGKPDGLVTLFFLLGLFLSESYGPSLGRAALAGALGALAFFVKPYGILALFWSMGSLFWRGRWKETGLAGATFTVCFTVLASWVRWSHPLYFEEVLLVNMNIAGRDEAYRWRQWLDLGFLCGALGGLALAALLWPGSRSFFERLARPWVLPCLASVALFHFKLSLHGGAYLTYFLQMAWPCMVLATASLLKGRGWERVLAPILAACTLALALKASALPFSALGDYRALDLRLRSELAPRQRPTGRGYAAWWLWPQGSVTLDYGQAEFARYGEDDHGWHALFPGTGAMTAKRERFERGMADLIRHKRFGVLALGSQEISPIESAALADYRIVADAYLTTPQMGVRTRLSLLKPKPLQIR